MRREGVPSPPPPPPPLAVWLGPHLPTWYPVPEEGRGAEGQRGRVDRGGGGGTGFGGRGAPVGVTPLESSARASRRVTCWLGPVRNWSAIVKHTGFTSPGGGPTIQHMGVQRNDLLPPSWPMTLLANKGVRWKSS